MGLINKSFAVLCLLVSMISTGIGASTAAEPVRIMALGDSLTAGYGLPTPDGFTAKLEAHLKTLGHDAVVLNAGVSGDTSAGGRARLDWSLSDKPDVAIIELGANDGLRGLDPKETKANLQAILDRLAEAKLPVLLTGMKAPPNLGSDYGAEFDGMYRELADANAVLFYPFFLEGVAGDLSLNQDDGIHPNAGGVDIIVANIAPLVIDLIKQAKP